MRDPRQRYCNLDCFERGTRKKRSCRDGTPRILAVLLLALIPAAHAATLSWTLPTQNTDGTMIAAGTTLTANVLQGPSGGPFAQIANVTGTTYTVASLTGGLCFEVEAVAVGAETGTSAPSNQVCVSAIPNPPSGLTVTVGSANTAYMEVRGPDKFSLVAVGTVPVGTKCDPTQDVDGYDAVPVSAVTWAGNVRPPVVVAKCG